MLQKILIPAQNIFQKKYTTTDGVEDYRYVDNAIEGIQVKANVGAVGAYSQYTAGQSPILLWIQNYFMF